MELNLLSWAILFLAGCGINGYQPKKIIGRSVEVRPGERPYQVSVWKRDPNQQNAWIYRCSGIILDKSHIITVAHCINGTEPSNIRIRAGSNDMMALNATTRTANRVYVHPEFGFASEKKGGYVINDIAIMTIDDFLPLDNISIAAVELQKSDVKAYQLGEVAGWGSRREEKNNTDLSRVLLKITMIVIKRKYCSREVPKTQFCTREIEDESTVGLGDSGSPLMINNYAAGIVMTSHDDNSVRLPVYYTNLYSYLKFIKKILKKF